MQRLKEHAEEQLRLSSEKSATDVREKGEASARAAASEKEMLDLKAAIAESLKEKDQFMRSRSQAADLEAALEERAKEMTKTMGMEYVQLIEKALDSVPKFHQFNMPQLSQETPSRPALRPHFAVPGPAAEGPAMPGTSGNHVLFNAEMHGAVDDMTLI
eukprot:635994-Pyramimonas_sp.AAC.1